MLGLPKTLSYFSFLSTYATFAALIVGLVYLGFNASEYLDGRSMMAGGIKTEARVVKVWRSARPYVYGKELVDHDLVYQFVDRAGVEHQNTVPYKPERLANISPGDTVDVMYNPSAPRESDLAMRYEQATDIGLQLQFLAMLMGSVWAFCMLLFWLSAQKTARERRVEREADQARAELEEARKDHFD